MRSDKYLTTEEVTEEVIEPKKKSKIKTISIFIFIILILTFLYARFVEPNIFIVHEYKVEHELIPESFNGFKIVHLSDIHYGTNINKEKLNKIVKKINELKPDIVVFTGDLFDKDIILNQDNHNDIIAALSNINTTLYKYAISGNEDLDNSIYFDILDRSDIILLDNKSKLIFNNGLDPIVLLGFPSINQEIDYSILENSEYDNIYKIALIHEPDMTSNIDSNLILAGHNMGGIINVFNPLFNQENSKKYNKKKYKLENGELFISNGLGTNKLNIRFNNYPSINLYRLYKK